MYAIRTCDLCRTPDVYADDGTVSKSFPPYEQRETPSQERILGDGDYNFAPVCDGKLFVGLALYRETAEYLYIEHFYILQALRNHRMGSGRWICWRNAARL